MKVLASVLISTALFASTTATASNTNADFAGRTYVYTVPAIKTGGAQDIHFWVKFFEGESRLVEMDDDLWLDEIPRCYLNPTASPCKETRYIFRPMDLKLELFSTHSGWPHRDLLNFSEDGRTMTRGSNEEEVYHLVE